MPHAIHSRIVAYCCAPLSPHSYSLNPTDPDLDELKKKLQEAQDARDSAHRDYQAGAEQIVARLKKELAEAEVLTPCCGAASILQFCINTSDARNECMAARAAARG